MSVEDVYAYAYPSRVLAQDLNSQRVTYRDLNGLTDSLEAPESLSTGIRNSPSQVNVFLTG